MPDVNKGKPYMDEKYFEHRAKENAGVQITPEEWLEASKAILMRDRDMLIQILDELEAEPKPK